jgi:hypothetical protein
MVDTPTLVKRSDRSSIYISDSFLFSSDEVGWGVSSACFMINDFLKYIFYVCLMFIIVKINNEFFFFSFSLVSKNKIFFYFKRDTLSIS